MFAATTRSCLKLSGCRQSISRDKEIMLKDRKGSVVEPICDETHGWITLGTEKTV